MIDKTGKNVIWYKKYLNGLQQQEERMAKKGKLGPMLAFGAVAAVVGGIAAYQHRKQIERTLQEIADQMDAWEDSGDFFGEKDNVVHTVTPAAEQAETPKEEEEDENAPTESDFVLQEDRNDQPAEKPET